MEVIKPYLEKIFVLRNRQGRPRRDVRDGMSKYAADRLSGVSLSSVKRYARIAERGVSLAPRKGGGSLPKADEITKGGCSKRT